jgi:hypothetical protein
MYALKLIYLSAFPVLNDRFLLCFIDMRLDCSGNKYFFWQCTRKTTGSRTVFGPLNYGAYLISITCIYLHFAVGVLSILRINIVP